jgi:hypothetical protein
MTRAQSMPKYWRTLVTVSAVTTLTATLLTAVSPAQAKDTSPTAALVGSFGVGGDATGGVNERTGQFHVQLPVASMPGINGGALDSGAVDVGLSYMQELAAVGANRFGLGAGWTWSGSFVDVDAGVRVFPASGGVFNADQSKTSGLDQYVLEDIVFSQEPRAKSQEPRAKSQEPRARSSRGTPRRRCGRVFIFYGVRRRTHRLLQRRR